MAVLLKADAGPGFMEGSAMPVEIRELVIKTTILAPGQAQAAPSAESLEQLRRELLQECQRMLQEQRQRQNWER